MAGEQTGLLLRYPLLSNPAGGNDADAVEGYSESKARIFAGHWETLSRLTQLIEKEKSFSNLKGVALSSEDSAISSVSNKSIRIPIAHPILRLRSFSRMSEWLALIQEDEWHRYG